MMLIVNALSAIGNGGSCTELLRNDPSLKGKDGTYTITINGEDFDVFCEMSTAGGGWTYVGCGGGCKATPPTDPSLDFHERLCNGKPGGGYQAGGPDVDLEFFGSAANGVHQTDWKGCQNGRVSGKQPYEGSWHMPTDAINTLVGFDSARHFESWIRFGDSPENKFRVRREHQPMTFMKPMSAYAGFDGSGWVEQETGFGGTNDRLDRGPCWIPEKANDLCCSYIDAEGGFGGCFLAAHKEGQYSHTNGNQHMRCVDDGVGGVDMGLSLFVREDGQAVTSTTTTTNTVGQAIESLGNQLSALTAASKTAVDSKEFELVENALSTVDATLIDQQKEIVSLRSTLTVERSSQAADISKLTKAVNDLADSVAAIKSVPNRPAAAGNAQACRVAGGCSPTVSADGENLLFDARGGTATIITDDCEKVDLCAMSRDVSALLRNLE